MYLYGSWNVFDDTDIFQHCFWIDTSVLGSRHRPHFYDDIQLIHSYWFDVDTDDDDNNDGSGPGNHKLFSTVDPFDYVHFVCRLNPNLDAN